MFIQLSEERADEIGEMLSIYFVNHDGISTNDELFDCYKQLGKRVAEISKATGISVDELISFGFCMVDKMVGPEPEENEQYDARFEISNDAGDCECGF